MKISNFSKFIGAGVIAASLAILPSTVSAQVDVAPNTYERPVGDVNAITTENDFDWGWLGLLGLAGLAGLAGRKRRDVDTVYTDRVTREPDVVTRREPDYR